MESEVAGQHKDKQEGSNLHFDKTYIKNDHFQRSITDPTIPVFVQRIKAYYQQVKHPLKVLDLCCGYGGPTFELFQALVKEEVEIDLVTGFDLSADQIAIAKERHAAEEKLRFQQKDIEQLDQNSGEFDVVTSFFGLHWVEDLEKVAKVIGVCLKPKGLFQAIFPMYSPDLYTSRVDFMESSRWKECLDQSIRKPTKWRQQKICKSVFQEHFTTLHGETRTPSMNYSRLEFMSVMSWIPEVRYLIKDQRSEVKKDVLTKAYLAQYVDSIPLRQSGNIVKKSPSEFVLNQPIYFYEGEKKEQI